MLRYFQILNWSLAVRRHTTKRKKSWARRSPVAVALSIFLNAWSC